MGTGTDGLQFKGIFVRHLRYLIEAINQDAAGRKLVQPAHGTDTRPWQAFIQTNARSIWQNAACAAVVPMSVGAVVKTPPLFGYIWKGPCSWAFGGPTATTQTAAIDVFTAAAATSTAY